ncbi:MAG: family 10 glycosylhydrolase [Paludibacter sp.]|nr:family 10 glycosylhydrolase [Paludibacter sp.]
MIVNKKFLLTLLFCFTAVSLSVFGQHKKFEMRGVWIATVANIDFPSKQDLTSDQQQQEIIRILDKLVENNINCIVLQVRPTADAFYPSPLEPWSNWLTGQQGKSPFPFYDPLYFIISQAHKRCMEVHLWLNPYRVTMDENINSLSKDHLFFKNRNIFVKYGNKYYFDPGLDQTREFLNAVVKDLVLRYDIDAIHFDDYFYPYPEGKADFDDAQTFRNFPRGFKNKADWRRNNVDMIISELQTTIKSNKPWVEFGISPFGVWRNKSNDPRGSDTQAGIANYDDLYADILKWLRQGTIDYVAPQLYWEIGKKVADYRVLLKWWAENSYGKNLYIGLFASGLKVNTAAAWKRPNEITRQLALNQNVEQVDGAMFFSAIPFISNLQGLNDTLQTNYYKYPALNPINRNISSKISPQVQNLTLIKDSKNDVLIWNKNNGTDGTQASYYVIYAFKGGKIGDMNLPENIIAKTQDNMLNLSNLKNKIQGKYTFVVTAVNRFRIESDASKPLLNVQVAK